VRQARRPDGEPRVRMLETIRDTPPSSSTDDPTPHQSEQAHRRRTTPTGLRTLRATLSGGDRNQADRGPGGRGRQPPIAWRFWVAPVGPRPAGEAWRAACSASTRPAAGTRTPSS
jgi:hypothetical protein